MEQANRGVTERVARRTSANAASYLLDMALPRDSERRRRVGFPVRFPWLAGGKERDGVTWNGKMVLPVCRFVDKICMHGGGVARTTDL